MKARSSTERRRGERPGGTAGGKGPRDLHAFRSLPPRAPLIYKEGFLCAKLNRAFELRCVSWVQLFRPARTIALEPVTWETERWRKASKLSKRNGAEHGSGLGVAKRGTPIADARSIFFFKI